MSLDEECSNCSAWFACVTQQTIERLTGFLRIHVKACLRPLLTQSETVPGRVKMKIGMQLVLSIRDYQII